MEEQCKQAIYSYADATTQMNAALTGEHKEYVNMVISLIRGDYHGQVKSGATTFTLSADIAAILTAERPW